MKNYQELISNHKTLIGILMYLKSQTSSINKNLDNQYKNKIIDNINYFYELFSKEILYEDFKINEGCFNDNDFENYKKIIQKLVFIFTTINKKIVSSFSDKKMNFLKLDNKNKLNQASLENLFYEMINNDLTLITKPLALTIDPISVCNLSCITCYQSDKSLISFSTLTSNSIKKISKLLVTADEIEIGGVGEPLLSKATKILSKQAKLNNVKTVKIITNGMLGKDLHEVSKNCSEILLSFDGATKETFEFIRKDSNFDLIIQNILNLELLERKKILLNFVLNELNISEVYKICEFAEKNNLKGINIVPFSSYLNLHSLLELSNKNYNKFIIDLNKAKRNFKNILINNYVTKKHFIDKDSLEKNNIISTITNNIKINSKSNFNLYGIDLIVDELTNIRKFDSNIINKFKFKKKSSSIKKIKKDKINIPYCLAPFTNLYIKNNGNYQVCCISDLGQGNINTTSINNIWNSKNQKLLRKSFYLNKDLPLVCKGCDFHWRFKYLEEYIIFLKNKNVSINNISVDNGIKLYQVKPYFKNNKNFEYFKKIVLQQNRLKKSINDENLDI